jgi:hypothetical protein
MEPIGYFGKNELSIGHFGDSIGVGWNSTDRSSLIFLLWKGSIMH